MTERSGRDLRLVRCGNKYLYAIEYIAYEFGSPFERTYTLASLEESLRDQYVWEDVCDAQNAIP